MSTATHPLDHIALASPCNLSWDAMAGDERTRFCSHCKLFVYNLSGMDRKAAAELIQTKEGRLCVRFFRRADGTLITRDCPVGLRAARKKALKLLGAMVACVLAVVVWTFAIAGGSWKGFSASRREGILRDSSLRQVEPFATLLEWLDPSPPVQFLGF